MVNPDWLLGVVTHLAIFNFVNEGKMGQVYCSNVPLELIGTALFFAVLLAVVFGNFVYDRFFVFLDDEDEELIDNVVNEIVERHEVISNDGRTS